MSIYREERVTYQAQCDRCGARGPVSQDAASAIEAVTVEATTKRVGVSLLGRWYHWRPDQLLCPSCFASRLGR